MKQLNPSTFSHRFIRLLILLIFIVVSFASAFAQCTGCTSTITTNNANITVAAGQVVCITYAGTFTKTITISGGTLCIGPSTTVTSAITMPASSTVNIYGSYTGSMSQNGGAITVYSGGTYNPSGFNINGGSLTINAGGTSTLGTPTFPSGYNFTDYGALTIAGFSLNSGASVTLNGTSLSITSSVTNNGTLSITGPATINGSFSQNSGAAVTFISGMTVTGSVSNNGTININGPFAVGGAYSSNSGATVKATGAGASCNAMTVGGSISGTGTFDGNGIGMTISPTPGCCMSNGATAVPATPSQQPTATAGSLSGNTVSGSFNAPSASIAGYIVLRYVGTVAPSCNPVNNTSYSVGSTIGTCTVAAMVTGGSTGTKSFTDNIPAATTNCGKNVYYRIFSYNGSGACTMFNTTSPLTGSLPIPAFTATVTAGGATTFCAGGSVTLTATAGSSYAWSTAATTQAITASAAATYTVTVTNAMGCTATASQAVTISTAPSPTVNSPSICSGATATLTATGGTSYVWSTGAVTTSITTSTAATYTVTATNAGGCTATASGTVTINAAPTASISASGATSFCTGSSVTLTASGGGTYLWSTGATTAGIGASTSATYTVTVTNAATCTATASKVVTVSTNPTAAIATSGATTFCSGGSVTLTASGGTTYAWSTGVSTAAVSVSTSGTYIVTVTNAGGCTATAQSVVTVYTLPSVTASSNTPVCVGTSISLTAVGSGSTSYTYSWSGPASYTATGSAATVANAATANGGNYVVTVTDNHSCTATATAAVVMDASCIDSTTVGANGGNSSDAPCTQILRFDHYNDAVAGAGGQNHTWILTGGNKLSMTITRTAGSLTSVTAPTWSGAGFGQSGYTGLSGKTVLYTVSSGWSKVVFSNIQMKDSNGNAITNFTLIGIDAESTDNAERDTIISNGTSWFDYDTITPPSIGSVPSETGIGTSTLVWTGTGGANARARLVSTNNPTNFSFSTVAGGLQGFAMGVANPIQAPTAVTICSKSAFTATPTNLPTGTTYVWAAPVISPAGSITGAVAQNTGVAVVGQTLTNTTSSPATATYTVIPSNNCSGLGYTVTVTVNPAQASVNNAAICTGGTATLTASGGNTYAWSTGATTTSITSTTASTYTVTTTSTLGCTATASGTVTVNTNPTASVNSPTVCAGTTATFTASGGSTYAWSTGATTTSISATTAGIYTVTVTAANSCTATASGTLTLLPLPSVTTSTSGTVCAGGSVTVTSTPVSGGTMTYSWSGPSGFTSTASSFTITSGTLAKSGTYTLTVTGSNTCTAAFPTPVSIVTCLTISGSVFDDANGNGMAASSDTISSYNQTIYAVLADTTAHVLASSAVAANGAFSFSNVLPSTSGMSVRVSTTNPAIGSAVPAASWPANWLGTLGQYGTNNLSGTGVYNNASELVPLKTGTLNVTGIMIGFDRLAAPVSQVYTISYPGHNTVKALTAAAGMGNIIWTDPEDGLNVGTFEVTGITLMHGNTLFYDSNANDLAEATEIINGYRAIANFNASKLKVKFTGMGSTNAMFSFDYIDAAGKTNVTSSTYKIQWSGGALPVKLEYFTADKKDEHAAALKWATASEINNDHFEVERSGDAQQWNKIGEVKGAGNSNEIIEYSLDDDAPLSGINYYRLKQVDVDGHFQYSDVAEVEFGAAEHSTVVMTIYPNPLPAGRPLNIALAGTSDAIKHISITNAIGQQVFKYDPTDEQGYKISGLTLPTGTYIVSVISQSNESFATKIVIQ